MYGQDGDYEDDDDVLREGIDECDGTVEHLKKEVDRLDDAVRRDQETAVVRKNEYSRVCDRVSSIDETCFVLFQACQQQGMLQAEVSANERNRLERDRYIEQLSEHTGAMITGVDFYRIDIAAIRLIIEMKNPEDFVVAFEKSVSDAESKLSDTKMQNKELDEKISEELRTVSMQIETASERMRLHKREKSQNDLKLAQLQKKATRSHDRGPFSLIVISRP